MSEDLEIKKKVEQIKQTFQKEAAKLRRSIISELYPVINGIYSLDTSSRNFELYKEAYNYFREKFKEKRGILQSIFCEDIEFSKLKDKLYLLFFYLGAIESVGNSIVDMLVLLLVANGRDFHIECRSYRTPKIRHVYSIREDLEKEWVPLGTKLSFLSENGIEKISRIIDSDLRNAIVHLKFEIKENRLIVKGEAAEIKILVGLRRLFVVINTVEAVMNKVAEDRGLLPKEDDKQ